MLTRLRLNFFVWVMLASLAACSVPSPVQTPPPSKGIDEPFFVQPERVASKKEIAQQEAPVDLLFLGDSITQNYDAPAHQPVWKKYFATHHALNLGYGMDTTGAMLWRFGHGELDGLKPRVTVLLIGTNDTNFGRSVDEVVTGISGVIDAIKQRLPDTKIIAIAILPSARSAEKTLADSEINAKNARLYQADPRVTFIDISSAFMKDGALNTDLYAEQPPEKPLHPNPKGQAVMAAAIEPIVKYMLDEAP